MLWCDKWAEWCAHDWLRSSCIDFQVHPLPSPAVSSGFPCRDLRRLASCPCSTDREARTAMRHRAAPEVPTELVFYILLNLKCRTLNISYGLAHPICLFLLPADEHSDIKHFPLSGLFSSCWLLVQAWEEGSNKHLRSNEEQRDAAMDQI